MSDDADIDSAIDAVLDGSPVDWDRVSRESPALAARLRIIAGVTAVHRRDVGPEPALLVPGAAWGPLRLERRIALGRYAEVWRATDLLLDRAVALKLFTRGLVDRVGDAATIKEGRLLARLRHPHIAAV